jgi:hypothetical protein
LANAITPKGGPLRGVCQQIAKLGLLPPLAGRPTPGFDQGQLNDGLEHLPWNDVQKRHRPCGIASAADRVIGKIKLHEKRRFIRRSGECINLRRWRRALIHH